MMFYRRTSKIIPALRKEVESFLQCAALEKVHELDLAKDALAAEATRKSLDKRFDASWKPFSRFIETEIIPVCGQLIARQEGPTFRLIVPSMRSNSIEQKKVFVDRNFDGLLRSMRVDFDERSSFHRDVDFRVPEDAVNLWVPLVDTDETTSLWIGGRHLEGRDAKPVCLRFGEYILFDGPTRWHGSIANTSGVSRVSFDFRLVFGNQTEILRQIKAED